MSSKWPIIYVRNVWIKQSDQNHSNFIWNSSVFFHFFDCKILNFNLWKLHSLTIKWIVTGDTFKWIELSSNGRNTMTLWLQFHNITICFIFSLFSRFCLFSILSTKFYFKPAWKEYRLNKRQKWNKTEKNLHLWKTTF